MVFLPDWGRPCAAADLQDEHVLPEVVAVFENDADGVFGQGGGVGPFELQPQGFLLGCHHFALLNLDQHKQCFLLKSTLCAPASSVKCIQ